MLDHCNPHRGLASGVVALIAFVSAAAPAPAQDAQAILQEAFRRTMSRPIRFEGSLTRFDPNNRVAQRSRWRFERTGPPGEGRVKITFLEPPDLKGVKLLILATPGRTTKQWLYTPATDRARPVRPAARGRRFYSTDFAFDDLQEADAGLLSYRLTGEREASGRIVGSSKRRCSRVPPTIGRSSSSPNAAA